MVFLQDELAKRHCFASVLYIAKTVRERGSDAETLHTHSNISLSQILGVFDVGCVAMQSPNMAKPRLKMIFLHVELLVVLPGVLCCILVRQPGSRPTFGLP